MRTLSLHESQCISGGVQTPYFSNAFLSGMKGESVDYILETSAGGIFGAFSGIVLGATKGVEVAILGGFLGLGIGALLGTAIAYNSYLLGRNYMEAQQLLKNT